MSSLCCRTWHYQKGRVLAKDWDSTSDWTSSRSLTKKPSSKATVKALLEVSVYALTVTNDDVLPEQDASVGEKDIGKVMAPCLKLSDPCKEESTFHVVGSERLAETHFEPRANSRCWCWLT